MRVMSGVLSLDLHVGHTTESIKPVGTDQTKDMVHLQGGIRGRVTHI